MWRVLRSPTWITLCFARHSDELDNLMTQFFVRADYENLWRLRPLTYLSWWDRGFMGEGYKVSCQHRFHPYQGRLTGEILLRAANPHYWYIWIFSIVESLLLLLIFGQRWVWWTEVTLPSPVAKVRYLISAATSKASSVFSVQGKEWSVLEKWETYFSCSNTFPRF